MKDRHAAARRWTFKRVILLLASLIPSGLIALLRPLGMSRPQGLVTAFLLLAIVWWSTRLVDRTVTSAVLLAAFCLFGNTPVTTVFTFPLSETFVLIILSFLFSEGVKNSGLLDKLLLPILARWATSVNRVLWSMLLVNLGMIFIIPQPFSRIILVSMIYDRFFRQQGLEEKLRSPLLFFLHSSSVVVNMAFLRGDLILNNAVLSISGVPVSEGQWVCCMAVPSILFAVFGVLMFRIIFRRQLAEFPAVKAAERASWSKSEYRNLLIIAATLLLWATEEFHGISGTMIVLGGTIAMVPLGLLRMPDLRCIDIKLLVFLTAAFSIGGVMKTSGTAAVIFSQFSSLFPQQFSLFYLLLILVITMVMHMILGSSITTLSVVIPSMLIIGNGVVPTMVLIFSVYIIASAHGLLPLHNVITMIGEGRGCFQSGEMTRYGMAMTVPTLLFVLLVFFGWWNFIGVGA